MFYALVFMHLQVKNFLKLLLCKKWQISHMTMRRPKDSVASRREGEITFIYILRYLGRFKCLKPRFEKFCFEVGTFTNTYTDWSNFWGIRSNDPDSVIIMRHRVCVISFPSSFRVDRRLSSLLYFFDLILGRFPPRRRRQPFKYRWGHNFHAEPTIEIFKSLSDPRPIIVAHSTTHVLDDVTLAGEEAMPTLVDALAEDFVEDSFVTTVFKDRIHSSLVVSVFNVVLKF